MVAWSARRGERGSMETAKAVIPNAAPIMALAKSSFRPVSGLAAWNSAFFGMPHHLCPPSLAARGTGRPSTSPAPPFPVRPRQKAG